MKDLHLFILSALIAVAASIITVKLQEPKDINSSVLSEDALTTILDRGVIRCGYVNYPPSLITDPNTGEISGIFAESIAAIAQNAGLKIDWVEEVGWGTMIQGLISRRYDMICSPVWANITRAKSTIFSDPIFYSAIGVYVRQDDLRFDDKLSALNNEQFVVTTIDGELSSVIRRESFPKTNELSLPQLSDNSVLLLNVASNKSDAAFVEPSIANAYLKSNPGSVRNAAANNPVRIYPNTFMFHPDDSRLRDFFNIAIQEIDNSGEINRILLKYQTAPDDFYRRGSQFSRVQENK